MPVYNGERSLERAVRSVLAQTYARYECIILDNCSTDATPNIIAQLAGEDSRIRVHRNPETYPVMKNHNAVIELASRHAGYCQILQADDALAPACLAAKVAVGEAHPEVDVIGCYSRWKDVLMPQQMADGQRFSGREIARLTLLGEIYPFISPSAVLFRSSAVFRRHPFYNEAAIHGDLQACYEILEHGDFGFVHETLTETGSSEKSVTSTVYRPLNRLIAANLSLLVDYGPRFLDEREYRQKLALRLDAYYEFLAKAVFERRGAEFWRFHRNALSSFGVPLASSRLARAALSELRIQPRATAARFVKSFGGGRP
jgi:glycosyltransferase involved in cell wall biosynthesis